MTEPALTRRRAVTGAAVGGLALPLLAACGGSNGASATPPATSGGNPTGGGQQASGAAVLVETAKVPVGGGVILTTQNVVVTQPKKGTFEGFSATCTHQGCQLANVAGGTINCGCHGSQFSISDGSNVTGPLGEPAGSVPPLPKVAIRTKGPDVVMG